MRNAHCRNWRMDRNLKIMEKEKHTFQDVKYGGKHKNVKNEKYTLQNLEYGKKTEKKGK